MNASTSITLTDNYGQVFTLGKSKTEIGSSGGADIVLDDAGVLEAHGEIRLENGAWILAESAAEATILANGVRIRSPYELKDGDVLSVGAAMLRVSLKNAAAAPSAETKKDQRGTTPAGDLSGFRSTGTYTSTAPGPTIQTAGPGPQTPPPPTTKVGQKSRTTAALLAIFLGGLGVHKFYLGKTVQGIIYLVFVWAYIPALLGLAEGIYYLTMNDQQFGEKYG